MDKLKLSLASIADLQDMLRQFVEQGRVEAVRLATLLKEPSEKVVQLFYQSEITDCYGYLKDGIAYQDILNTLLLYYTLKPYYILFTTSYPPTIGK